MIESNGKITCDGCGKDVTEEMGGYICPTCGRVYCSECEPDYELRRIHVRETGPDYKKYEDMCPTCATAWRKKNAKPMTLDGYL